MDLFDFDFNATQAFPDLLACSSLPEAYDELKLDGMNPSDSRD